MHGVIALFIKSTSQHSPANPIALVVWKQVLVLRASLGRADVL